MSDERQLVQPFYMCQRTPILAHANTGVRQYWRTPTLALTLARSLLPVVCASCKSSVKAKECHKNGKCGILTYFACTYFHMQTVCLLCLIQGHYNLPGVAFKRTFSMNIARDCQLEQFQCHLSSCLALLKIHCGKNLGEDTQNWVLYIIVSLLIM